MQGGIKNLIREMENVRSGTEECERDKTAADIYAELASAFSSPMNDETKNEIARLSIRSVEINRMIELLKAELAMVNEKLFEATGERIVRRINP